MALFSQEFKVKSVEKALSKRSDQPHKKIAYDLGVGCSTLHGCESSVHVADLIEDVVHREK